MQEQEPVIQEPVIQEPIVEVSFNQSDITLLGTAHVSRASAETVKTMLESGDFDAVAVELCANRYRALTRPDDLSQLNLIEVIRTGKAPMIAANLALGAYQQRLAEQFGILPGAEMRAAIDYADRHGLPIWMIDRDVGVTLKRAYRNIPWWRRLYWLTGLLASVVSKEKIDEAEIERLKESDILESTFAQFAEKARDLYTPLIDERDRFMAARLQAELTNEQTATRPERILAVVGAGHLKGLQAYLQRDATEPPPQEIVTILNQVPPSSGWPKLIPWFIVGLIIVGFGIGFYRSPEIGWHLVKEWVLINGTLCAIGALLAAAHPLTVITAFVAAPITSLNPTVGAGMVTAVTETWLRKPKVADFAQLRADTTHFKGWWKNRVTKILLVFLLSTMGSAIGTYVAGFRIIDRLS